MIIPLARLDSIQILETTIPLARFTVFRYYWIKMLVVQLGMTH